MIYLLLFLLLSCSKNENPKPIEDVAIFENTPISYPVKPGKFDEASGIAISKLNPGRIWVEQDSGNPPELIAIDTNANLVKKIPITGVTNRDWEDMSLAPGPEAGKNYIYLAETGDNNQKDSSYAFYRFLEPSISIDNITGVDKLSFKYPDGPHDAEGFFVSPSTKDIYIITKRDSQSRVYRLPYPQSISTATTATYVGSLPFSGVTSAAISADGSELMIKTYAAIYYWKRNGNETPETSLTKEPTKLGYQMEQQGEAITFDEGNSGFYTLSEKPLLNPVNLNFYKRK
ncbi:MAG: hypothetical protein ABIR81_00815 [Ginsengibacter sp.]